MCGESSLAGVGKVSNLVDSARILLACFIFCFLKRTPKVAGIEAVDLGGVLRVISHRVDDAKEDVDELRIVLVKFLDLFVSGVRSRRSCRG